MTDRKALILIAVQAATLLALVAVVLVLVMQHGESRADAEKMVAELRSVREARYEYKVVVVLAEGAADRQGEEAMKFAMVTPNESELTGLGSSGWEVVTSYLEMETAYPNFGNDKYVTGLQTNVRPQRVVLVLRRRVA